MRAYLSRSNFCAECGNRREEPVLRAFRQHRYLCDHCATRLGKMRIAGPLITLCCGLAMGFALAALRANNSPDSVIRLHEPAAPVISARDATARLEPAPPPVAMAQDTFQCGARTRKGTPCKHRVREQGARCPQHQGRPSILKTTPTPAAHP
ncbi:MAG: hypothetical protein ACKV2V_13790 [Blastocatellia bacterium]